MRTFCNKIIGCTVLSGVLLAQAAEITVTDTEQGETPAVLAYNLGHFYSGSNAADWWRFSNVTGGRTFLGPENFELYAQRPPIDQAVTDQTTFLAARERLLADPLSEQNIKWTELREFMKGEARSINRISINYSLQEITRRSPDVLIQLNVHPKDFPINGESDWAGKWRVWRSYFSMVYYYASEFGIQRFGMANEPNLKGSLIEPEDWLMRAKLAADATEQAVALVNQRQGTSLQSKMVVPILAGGLRSVPEGPYRKYSRLILNAWGTDFLGRETGKPLYSIYSQQPYSSSPAYFAEGLPKLKKNIARDLPQGMPFPRLAFTEFNVHTGKDFDTIPETMDSPIEFTRLGVILGALMTGGLDEFYLYKFGLTPAMAPGRTYPVHKNGMHYCDNDNAPYNYGGPTRGADVYRLFCQAFQPGREQLELKIANDGGLRAHAARDPETGDLWVYTVNPEKEPQPLQLDLTPWAQSLAGSAVVSEVSEARGGELVLTPALEKGRRIGMEQPAESVWLIHLPASREPAEWIEVPVEADAMVADGSQRGKNMGAAQQIQVVNSVVEMDGRRAGLFRFQMPDIPADRILEAVVEFPARLADVQQGTSQVQVFLSDHANWNEADVSWSSTVNLRQCHPAGAKIKNRVVQGQGDSVFIAGQLNVSSPAYQMYGLEVTDLLRTCAGTSASFLLVQEPRWDVNSLNLEMDGDIQSGGIDVAAQEQSAVPPASIRLLVKSVPAQE